MIAVRVIAGQVGVSLFWPMVLLSLLALLALVRRRAAGADAFAHAPAR